MWKLKRKPATQSQILPLAIGDGLSFVILEQLKILCRIANGCANENNEVAHDVGHLLSAVLEALDVLTYNNLCQTLERIPVGLWTFIHKSLQILWKWASENRTSFIFGDHIFVLPRILVWLIMEQEVPDESVHSGHKNPLKLLFEGRDAEFTHFWNEHWEHSPCLMEEGAMGSKVRIGLLSQTWHEEQGVVLFLQELLTKTLACPAFSSDELEAAEIYKEIEEMLGRQLIYGQDIRLVKSSFTTGHCAIHSLEEEDYKRVALEANTKSGDSLYADVQSCLDAFGSGYTIALRGLEFRCSQIAAIAEALAICLGQATVGANLYVTPPNAQGFKPHYDDHCVLVWQLSGSKAWTIWPPPICLPRLYSQDVKIEYVCADKDRICGIFLKEGSILYIPRGFLHAAQTKKQAENNERPMETCNNCNQAGKTAVSDFSGCPQIEMTSNMIATVGGQSKDRVKSKQFTSPPLQPLPMDASTSANCDCLNKNREHPCFIGRDILHSVHVTFGVEVEPPFDWEGLIHMSLHCWAEEQDWEDLIGRHEIVGAPQAMRFFYEGLLHVAIRKCSDEFSKFRKACLVAAKPLHNQTGSLDGLELYFEMLLQIVAQRADFRAAFDVVVTIPDSNCLDWMRWLRHLSGTEDETELWSNPMVSLHNALRNDGVAEGLKAMEAKFTNARDRFVLCANFARARQVFVALLLRYRAVRKRYSSAMLALQT